MEQTKNVYFGGFLKRSKLKFIFFHIIIFIDNYSGDYRDARALIGRGLRHIYTLFDGLTYNTRGYFASCVVFFRAP